MKKKIVLTSALIALAAYGVMAQPDFATGAKGFYDKSVRPLFPILIVLIAVAVIVPNLGKVTGEERDYKGFFFGIGRYLLAVMAVVATIAFLWTQALR